MQFDPQQKALIQSLLPKYITAERFFSLAEFASRNPGLRNCTPASMVRCFIQLAEVGLEPNTPLGHAYIIPFKHEKTGQTIATIVIGWRGMIDKAVRAKAASKIVANVVRAGDIFKYRPVDPVPILHEPGLEADDEDTDSIIGAYAVATLPDGSMQAEWMSRKQIDRIHARSKARDSGPWVTDFAEMARKCPTRRLFKYLPVSGQEDEIERFGKSLDLDNHFFSNGKDEQEDDFDPDAPPALAAPAPQQEQKRGRGRPPKQQEPQQATAQPVQTELKQPETPLNGPPVENSNAAPPEPVTGAPVASDRALSAAEYDDLWNQARKAHPNNTLTWLADVLQDNFGIVDLGNLRVSQIPMYEQLMKKA